MDRLGRRSLVSFGLLLIAAIDVLSIVTADYRVFLTLRAVGGSGWAMFATVATTSSVGVCASERRGRAVSLLFRPRSSEIACRLISKEWRWVG